MKIKSLKLYTPSGGTLEFTVGYFAIPLRQGIGYEMDHKSGMDSKQLEIKKIIEDDAPGEFFVHYDDGSMVCLKGMASAAVYE